MISLVIDEAYRRCTDVAGGSPKRYRRGIDSLVDDALDRHRIVLDDQDPYWRDVVTALCGKREWRMAERAQRYAVPTLEDLLSASRAEQVRDLFGALRIEVTHERVAEIFARYMQDLIRRYPILNQPTRLDFGPARIIVLDLAAVAPTGSPAANRQTEMMYLLGRHILGRNFFLHPDYVRHVPEHVRDYHRARFQEAHEGVKRLDFDEWHRTAGSEQVRAQAALDVREGRKHNVQMGFSSQRLGDMDDALIAQSTGRFVLRAGDETEAEEIVKRFNLSEASAQVVRFRLNGPGPEGAPFLAVLSAAGGKYEQMLVNTLGSKELWALSTTPGDTALRDRLYEAIGFSEALRRLSQVFPRGSALTEIERRRSERLKRGELEIGADAGVIDELAGELVDGRGIAFKLRAFEDANKERTALAAE